MRCDLCKFWKPDMRGFHDYGGGLTEIEEGQCRRYPPVLDLVTLQEDTIGPPHQESTEVATSMHVWANPITSCSHCCGEFSAKRGVTAETIAAMPIIMLGMGEVVEKLLAVGVKTFGDMRPMKRNNLSQLLGDDTERTIEEMESYDIFIDD